jgi:transposase-like protein
MGAESQGSPVNLDIDYGIDNPPSTLLQKKGSGSASLAFRMEVLRHISDGVSIRSLAKQVGVQPSTIRYWRKKAQEIDMSTFKSYKKSLHTGRKPAGLDIEEELARWITHQRRNQLPITINSVVNFYFIFIFIIV